MDGRGTEKGGLGDSGMNRDPERTSAGPANTPLFDRDASAGERVGSEGGRPPSHREADRGRLSGDRMEGIALPETQRVLEETRDKVAKEAAPVVAEKMQEAITETTERLGDTMGEQAKKTAEALRHDAGHAVEQKAGEVLNRVENSVDRGIDRAAEGLQTGARRLHETADRIGGPGVRGTASRVAHQAADLGEDAAGYLRETDFEDLRSSLEHQVRERPLQTLAIAAAAGWLVGKILR